MYYVHIKHMHTSAVPFPSSHPYLDIIFDATELPTLGEQYNWTYMYLYASIIKV